VGPPPTVGPRPGAGDDGWLAAGGLDVGVEPVDAAAPSPAPFPGGAPPAWGADGGGAGAEGADGACAGAEGAAAEAGWPEAGWPEAGWPDVGWPEAGWAGPAPPEADVACFAGDDPAEAGALGAAAPPVADGDAMPGAVEPVFEGRMTLVGDSALTVARPEVDSDALVSAVFGVSTGGSSAPVEAPAAPDFACVSVIQLVLFFP
jgi:hypothetical protein